MKLSVVIFCGGRGAASIINACLCYPEISLTLVVNGYDNGLSTGKLRSSIPGLLGPSDFRKNYVTHTEPNNTTRKELLKLFGKRLCSSSPESQLAAVFAKLEQLEKCSHSSVNELQNVMKDLEIINSSEIITSEVLSECSIGNLFMAGGYIRLANNFNDMIDKYLDVFKPKFDLYNVNDGTNLFLIALKKNGEIIADEASIVAPQSRAPITDLFLIKSKSLALLKNNLENKKIEYKRTFLKELAVLPETNKKVIDAIRQSDLIVVGPGTQNSSILPSFICDGTLRHTMGEVNVPIVQIINLRQDFDIQGWTAENITRRLAMYLDSSSAPSHVLVDKGVRCSSNLTSSDIWTESSELIQDDFDSIQTPGTHDGTKIVTTLRSILDSQF